MKQDLYIIAAGKGSRMGGHLPKALVPISDDEPCLTTTLKQIAHKFRNVFVVVNVDILDVWVDYLDGVKAHTSFEDEMPSFVRNVYLLPIKSGLGDGHAVMSALQDAQFKLIDYEKAPIFSNDIAICWGDVFFPHAELIDELMSRRMTGAGLLPAVREDSPYVTLI